jgi:hypothetical protein
MKLIDKIKNYFYDDDESDAKTEQLPKVEQSTAKVKVDVKESKKDVPKGDNLDVISERELFKSDPTFNFPIIFDEDDFAEDKVATNTVTNNVKSSIKTSRFEQNKVVEHIEPKVFKPSLNISPVYGVISDKKETDASNGRKDNLLNLYDENKKIDIDEVLEKAYSQRRVDLKSEVYTNVEEVKPVVKDELSIDLFNNLDSKDKEEEIIDEPLVDSYADSYKDVDEKLKSIDELLENTEDDDFYSLVDSMYKENDEEGDK